MRFLWTYNHFGHTYTIICKMCDIVSYVEFYGIVSTWIYAKRQRQDQARYGSFTEPDRRQIPFSAVNRYIFTKIMSFPDSGWLGCILTRVEVAPVLIRFVIVVPEIRCLCELIPFKD